MWPRQFLREGQGGRDTAWSDPPEAGLPRSDPRPRISLYQRDVPPRLSSSGCCLGASAASSSPSPPVSLQSPGSGCFLPTAFLGSITRRATLQPSEARGNSLRSDGSSDFNLRTSPRRKDTVEAALRSPAWPSSPEEAVCHKGISPDTNENWRRAALLNSFFLTFPFEM